MCGDVISTSDCRTAWSLEALRACKPPSYRVNEGKYEIGEVTKSARTVMRGVVKRRKPTIWRLFAEALWSRPALAERLLPHSAHLLLDDFPPLMS